VAVEPLDGAASRFAGRPTLSPEVALAETLEA